MFRRAHTLVYLVSGLGYGDLAETRIEKALNTRWIRVKNVQTFTDEGRKRIAAAKPGRMAKNLPFSTTQHHILQTAYYTNV